MIFIYFILFIAAVIFSFYIPGYLLIRFFRFKFTPLESLFFSLLGGISLFLLSTYLLSYLQISLAYLGILFVINLYGFKLYLKEKNKISFDFKNIDYWSVLLILLGSGCFAFIMYFSGYIFEDGMKFMLVNAADGVRHIAYINNLINIFPPQHPGLSGVELKGFHYFYDFMLAKFALFYKLPVLDLYFRLFPVFISFLYGASFYIFATKITKNQITKRLILFFAYFSAGFSLLAFMGSGLIDVFKTETVHPIGLIVNPFIVLAIAMLVGGFSLLPDIKKSFKYALFLGLIFGVLAQIKVYNGIIVVGTISVYALYLLIKYKKKYVISLATLLFVTALITAVTFLPNNFRQGGLVFAPFLFYRQFMETHIFSFLNWETKWRISFEAGDMIKVYLLYIQAAIIYWIYNLGLQMVILAKIKKLFSRGFWEKDYNFILFMSILIPIVLVSFIVQTVQVYDTVQFLWITFPLLSIPTAIAIESIFRKHKNIFKFIIVAILLFSLPKTIATLWDYMPSQSTAVNKNSLRFFNNVKLIVPEGEFIIYLPKELSIKAGTELTSEVRFYRLGAPLVSALSGRALYLGNGNLPGKLDKINSERFDSLVELKSQILSCDMNLINKSLEKIGSKYLLSEENSICLATNSAILKTVSSDTFNLYQFK